MAYVVDGTIRINGREFSGDPENGKVTIFPDAEFAAEDVATLVRLGALRLEAEALPAAATQAELDSLRAQLAAAEADKSSESGAEGATDGAAAAAEPAAE